MGIGYKLGMGFFMFMFIKRGFCVNSVCEFKLIDSEERDFN